jgi:membrane protease YdiL (CAAX protease family)
MGVIFGCGVVAAMFLLYTLVLPETLVTQLDQKVQAKVESTGMASPIRFLGLSLFYVAGHSFLEEYYWRWFVFDQLQQKMSMWKANLIAGLGFMAHHVVLLGTFFGWDSIFTYVLSLSIAVGGMVWAWLFNRRCGFRAAWLSHAIVDAGIFALGMLILFAKH